ncbi:hypothetical protein [Aquimarina rhabdastrellae]
MEKEKIKKEVLEYIKNNPKEYPFIARFWDVKIEEHKPSKEEIIAVKFGHFNTHAPYSIPFYKPISKIVDLSKLI